MIVGFLYNIAGLSKWKEATFVEDIMIIYLIKFNTYKYFLKKEQ